MKCECIALANNAKEFDEFIARDGKDIVIHSKHLAPRISWDAVDIFYFFYDEIGDLVKQETQRIQQLKSIAARVRTGAGYAELKNQRQREIWILDKEGLIGRDAADVIELAKPEMAAVLGSGT